jgi:three-Cys-motif partner protein
LLQGVQGETSLGYIDAFAGTGYRFAPHEDEAGESQAPLFPDLAEREPQALLDGSARIALKTEPRFDSYVFIERSAERCAQLEALKLEFPHLANDIDIRHLPPEEGQRDGSRREDHARNPGHRNHRFWLMRDG